MTNLPNSNQANSLDNFNVDRADYRQSMENLLAFLAQGLGGVTGTYGTQAVNPAAIKLSGLPTAPTAAPGTNTTQLATTAFVKAAADAATGPWSRTGTDITPKTAGDVVSVSAGTAALPGLAVAGDPNTGLWAPAADTLALSLNGVEHVRILPTGNVLIGGTLPSSQNITLQSDGLVRAVHFRPSALDSAAAPGLQVYNEPDTGFFRPAANAIGATVGGVEAARLTSDGYLRMAAGTKGIQFGGDTAAANALNDYEEGTFTPVAVGTATAGTGTYTHQVGTYVKIGKLVHVEMRVAWTAHDGTNKLRVSGLPFIAKSGTVGTAASSLRFENLTIPVDTMPTAVVGPGTTFLSFESCSLVSGVAAQLAIDSSADLVISVTYYANV